MVRFIKLIKGFDFLCGGKKENVLGKIEIFDFNEIMLFFFFMFFDNLIIKVSEVRDCLCR